MKHQDYISAKYKSKKKKKKKMKVSSAAILFGTLRVKLACSTDSERFSDCINMRGKRELKI